MTSPHTIRNHQLGESARALPPGRWVSRRGVQHFIPDQPALQFAAPCHCGDYYPPGASCETCLTWAERDAERWSWERQRRENRGRIWAILDARKSVAA